MKGYGRELNNTKRNNHLSKNKIGYRIAWLKRAAILFFCQLFHLFGDRKTKFLTGGLSGNVKNGVFFKLKITDKR